MMKRRTRVHILGGGFSGLMAAYFCQRAGLEVVVSEASRWGGLIHSVKTEWGLAEEAAPSFLWTPTLARVARDVDASLVLAKKGSRKRYVANEKPVPLSAMNAGPALMKYFWARVRGAHRPEDGESLAQWGVRIVGREFTDRILMPATQGIWGLTADQLSARLILSPIFERDAAREKRKGSAAPMEGMGTLINALVSHLRAHGADLRLERVSEKPDADHVILATGWRQKSEFLRASHPEAALLFDQMRATSVTTTTVFYEKKGRHPYPGFGVLFHPSAGWNAAGVLFNDQIFEGRGPHQSEAWISTGTEGLRPTQVLELIRQDRERLGLSGRQLGFHQREWNQVLPQYTLEHEKILSCLQSHREKWARGGMHLLGNELGEIGLASLAEKAKHLSQSIGGRT